MVRLKHRYMVIEINPTYHKSETVNQPFKIPEDALYLSIQRQLQKLHGDFGVAATRPGFRAKYCNELTRIAIIRCGHGPHKLVASVIPFITDIANRNVSVNILYLGATLRKCFGFIKTYHQQKYDEFCAQLDSEEAKQSLRDALLNFENTFNALGS